VQLYTSPQGRFRAWRPRELVALVADQPPLFPPGTAWSYSNTGFLNVALTTEDGRRQVVVMMNEEFATPAVYEAFNQAVAAMVERLLGAVSPGEASTGSSLRAAVQARESARTAEALARAGMASHARR
jgi:hypothetical protein